MSNKIKCFWCKGKTKLGVHSKCWKVFSGWMLSNREEVDMSPIDADERESLDDFQRTGETYLDKAGRTVMEGRVQSAPNYDTQEM